MKALVRRLAVGLRRVLFRASAEPASDLGPGDPGSDHIVPVGDGTP
jgi:hypothetical protein